MKLPIAITFFCTTLFACSAVNPGGENNSISLNEAGLDSSVESSEAIEPAFLVGLISVSGTFTPDGPDGPEPCTHVEGTAKADLITATVGDGCSGDKGIKGRLAGQSGPVSSKNVPNTPGGGCCGPHMTPGAPGPISNAYPTPR